MLKEFMIAKKEGESARTRKGLVVRPNGRSADFIIPSFATGCPLVCAYCCISRHRPFGNPLERYTNWDDIWEATRTHIEKLPPKTPNQCDPVYWTYDIGESTDCLAPQNQAATLFFINKFQQETEAKFTFATKLACTDFLPELSNNRGRIRVSLMPDKLSKILEPVTSPITKRIEAINKLVEKGYEVHINFSPVILHTDWQRSYAELLLYTAECLSPQAKNQLKAEVIFLTHHPLLHKLNMAWSPEAEQLLWQPKLQETKTTQRGDCDVVRYRARSIKQEAVDVFKQLVKLTLPECGIRYIF